MELAAVVVVPDTLDFGVASKLQSLAAVSSGLGRAASSCLLPILGNDVLQTWTDRIRKVGVRDIWLTSASQHGMAETKPALRQLVRQGIERLLMIKLKSYAEMDLSDLVRFHCERGSSVTEVLDSHGRLGISLYDQLALSVEGRAGNFTRSACTQYSFDGYAKRILTAKERQELVCDALTGACAMRPVGEQIGEQVWMGNDVDIAQSAKIVGPSYIGDRATIRAGTTIGPFASVECDCVVDCGTAVERSTVLPATYVGIGLMVRHAMVDGSQLQDLDSGVVADLQPAGLARRISQRRSKHKTFWVDPQISSPDWNAWLGGQYAHLYQQVQS
ncbi:MAG: hypothetical protein ACRD3B_10120 [Candidatus Sulfotelmatobacter sp.]